MIAMFITIAIAIVGHSLEGLQICLLLVNACHTLSFLWWLTGDVRFQCHPVCVCEKDGNRKLTERERERRRYSIKCCWCQVLIQFILDRRLAFRLPPGGISAFAWNLRLGPSDDHRLRPFSTTVVALACLV